MIYWVLHKKMSVSDWTNPLEGEAGFFYEKIQNLIFVDISGYGIFAKIESVLVKDKNVKYDISGIPKNRYFEIKSVGDTNILLSTCTSKDIFLFQAYGNPRISLFVSKLNKKKIKTVLLNHWQTPSTEKIKHKKNRNWIISTLHISKKLLLMRCISKIYAHIVHTPIYFDYVLAGGNQFLKKTKKRCSIGTVVPVHSISYDEYLSVIVQNPQRLIQQPYFVFIDQALTIHPEFKRFTPQDTLTYQKEILKTFKDIEKQYNIKIVVAEHPRCRYNEDFWNSYERRQKCTASLVCHAEGVIGHFSGSLNLARLFDKKNIIFLTSSSRYFEFRENVKQAFNIFGGELIDMATGQKEICKGSNTDLTEIYTLLPSDKRRNRELFTDFLQKFDFPK